MKEKPPIATIQRYEELYTRLQEIVARLESGALTLDESLALYEEGATLALSCQRLLETATLRVQELQQSGDSADLMTRSG